MSSSGASGPKSNRSKPSESSARGFSAGAAGAASSSDSDQSPAASALLNMSRSASPNKVSAIELLMSSIDFAVASARIVLVSWSSDSAATFGLAGFVDGGRAPLAALLTGGALASGTRGGAAVFAGGTGDAGRMLLAGVVANDCLATGATESGFV